MRCVCSAISPTVPAVQRSLDCCLRWCDGSLLLQKVRDFSRMRAEDKTGCEIDFSEFLVLMDSLGLVPVVGDQEAAK